MNISTAEKEFTRRIDGLPVSAMQQTQRDGGWTRQQVAEHLMLAFRSSGKVIEKAAAGGPVTFPAAKPKERVAKFVVLTLGRMPGGREAPEWVEPRRSVREQMDGSVLAAEFRRVVQEMTDAINKAQAALGPDKPIANHFVLGPLTAEQWLRFHTVHCMHHVKQLDRIAANSAAK